MALLIATLPAAARAADVVGPATEASPAPAGGPGPEVLPAVTEPEHMPAPAPMTAEARAHYEQGLRLYGDRNFPAAIRELEAGFVLEPRREFLFAEAQAYRLAGDCAQAIRLYERFLGSGPSPLQVDATRLALDRCARRPPVTTTAAVPRPPAPGEGAPWWHDPWALGASSAGVAAIGVGLGFVIASRSAADRANDPTTTTRYPDYDHLWNTAEQRQTIGIAALATGGALLAASAIRLLWLRRRPAPARAGAPPAGALIVPNAHDGGATLLGQVSF